MAPLRDGLGAELLVPKRRFMAAADVQFRGEELPYKL